ncbi:hypothetical protein PM082_014811 [Marasmius tenuissimus]|nr:hypothetical protein PM082_014811 [Marasmius tenuissimus]
MAHMHNCKMTRAVATIYHFHPARVLPYSEAGTEVSRDDYSTGRSSESDNSIKFEGTKGASMDPTFFPNAQGVSITGGSFSNVLGDQHNYDRRQMASQTSQMSHSPSRNERRRTLQEAGAANTLTVVHINGDQINHQMIQPEGKKLTEFHDVSCWYVLRAAGEAYCLHSFGISHAGISAGFRTFTFVNTLILVDVRNAGAEG